MYEVVGSKAYNFTDSRTNRQVEGVTLYCLSDEDATIEGKEAKKLSLSSPVLTNLGFCPVVGDQIDVFYNEHGRVKNIVLLNDVDR